MEYTGIFYVLFVEWIIIFSSFLFARFETPLYPTNHYLNHPCLLNEHLPHSTSHQVTRRNLMPLPSSSTPVEFKVRECSLSDISETSCKQNVVIQIIGIQYRLQRGLFLFETASALKVMLAEGIRWHFIASVAWSFG